jgi:hypothetical protein
MFIMNKILTSGDFNTSAEKVRDVAIAQLYGLTKE